MKVQPIRIIVLCVLLIVNLSGCRGRGARQDNGETPVVPTNQPTSQIISSSPTESVIETASPPTPTTEPPTIEPPTATLVPSATTAPATELALQASDNSGAGIQSVWQQANELPPGVPFSVTVTEDQMTASINERLTASGYGTNISELAVSLDNGQIVVTFKLTIQQQVGPRTIDVSAVGTVVSTASLDASGAITVSVVSANFGQISLPPEMLAPINESLSEAITGSTSGKADNVTFTSLTIDDGLMVTRGYVTK